MCQAAVSRAWGTSLIPLQAGWSRTVLLSKTWYMNAVLQLCKLTVPSSPEKACRCNARQPVRRLGSMQQTWQTWVENMTLLAYRTLAFACFSASPLSIG